MDEQTVPYSPPLPFLEFIANPPDGVDIVPIGSKLIPQEFDLPVNRAVITEVFIAPHLIEQLVTGQDDPLVLPQAQQQTVFLRREFGSLTIYIEFVTERVQRQSCHLEPLLFLRS